MTDAAIVVIPYFQREPGILARSLRSVARQVDAGAIRVYVVDDASPAPAVPEIAAIDLPFREAIEIITQPNGGPGAARNRALDTLPPGARYVAFLDSDDEWLDDHLANARRALEAGHDVYFANHTQLGQTVGAFERAGRIRPADHPPIDGADFLHAYQGDMLSQIVLGNVIGTSTVVYDFGRFHGIRFRPEFRNAGEDYLFWMDLASRGARFAFSELVEASYGKGVNVYSGSGWGTEAHLERLTNELRYRKLSRRAYGFPPAVRRLLRQKEGDLRIGVVRDILHRLGHRNLPPLARVAELVRVDPMIVVAALPILARILLGRT